ncbi:MAG: GDP-mannose 4,6-dehydratase [Candidatus Pacearchaeota archaeon]
MNKHFWENKNVLVTGAGGFKGSHLVQELVKTKARVVSLIRDFDPRSYFQLQELEKKSTVVIGDLKDYKKIADIISKYEITTIFHLGAQPIVTTALINPLETLESNIMGTVNILEAARLYSKISEIVVVSSDKAYGSSEKIPYKEDERLHGKAPYDVSKSCADLISQMYYKVYKMPITITRCSNVFGPGDLNMNRIIPGIMEAAIKNKTLQIRSDGKMIREYIYVKDTIDAYIKLAENINKSKGEAFNIAGKNVMSVIEVVKRVSSIINKPIKINILNKAKTEILKQHLDGTKMKQYFGWEPKTKFEDAINETYEWYEENLK